MLASDEHRPTLLASNTETLPAPSVASDAATNDLSWATVDETISSQGNPSSVRGPSSVVGSSLNTTGAAYVTAVEPSTDSAESTLPGTPDLR